MIARFYDEEPEARERHQVTDATAEALTVLDAYRWPGNIRELRNVIFGALVRKRAGKELLASDLPARLFRPEETPHPERGAVDARAVEAAVSAGGFNLRAAIEALERAALTAALARTAGNASAAASLLGEVGRGSAQDPGATVRSMMRRLGVEGRPRRPPPRRQ
jgi:two-component system response regulator GlrR